MLQVVGRADAIPEGVCVWVGPGSVLCEGEANEPRGRRYGHLAHEEGHAPRVTLTPRMTPSVTPAKLPALIPTLALAPQATKRPREAYVSGAWPALLVG
jgi:hypothetical protein